MKHLIFLLMICFTQSIFAQENRKGIIFARGLTWNQLKSRAKSENKYIFVDCYATWCAPCKKMDQEVFTNDTIGDFVNKKFISVKVQIDTSKNDNAEIKSWYVEANKLQKENNISEFPSYLFFSPKGELVTRNSAFQDTRKFKETISEALDTSKQYYSLLRKYQSGDRNKKLIKNLVPEALRLRDLETAKNAADYYVDCIDSPFIKEQLSVIIATTYTSTGKGYKFLLANSNKIDNVLGKNEAQSVVIHLLRSELFRQFLYKKKEDIDWDSIKTVIKQKAPEIADQLYLLLQVTDYNYKKKWNEYSEKLLSYYDKYSSKMTMGDLWAMNNNLWGIFESCDNLVTLEHAIQWSITTLYRDGKENPVAIDTYANLLYKSGKIKEGIAWEENAINVAIQKGDDRMVKEGHEYLEKMKLGLPTWSVPNGDGNKN